MIERPASHSGQWYPSDGKFLYSKLDVWLDSEVCLKTTNEQNTKAIIVPHAGYKYSGIVAASSYAILKKIKPKLVVLLGPSHFKFLPNQCGLSQFHSAQTPMGSIKLDTETAKNLSQSAANLFKFLSSDEDIKEHSLEMQFPFLYKIYGNDNIKMLPIQVGHFSDDLKRKEAANILSTFLPSLHQTHEIVFVISSDFCHYGNRFDYKPKFEGSEISLNESISLMDKVGFDTLNSVDPIKNFKEYLDTTGNTICGREPILLFLELFNLNDIKGKWEMLDYAQSNFLTSINDHSVSYLAAVFSQDDPGI